MINVDGSDDPSYRYKMPRLLSKVEGRGNGVKTVLVNCSDIAASLHRSTAQVCKFFGCELGAMTNYEEKADKALVNGSFVTKDLQEALTGYIQKFVLCPSCGNPETVQELKGKKKSAFIVLNCKACGASELADNTHKLFTFIVKELSNSDSSISKKEKRRLKKLEKNKNKDEESKDSSSVSEGDSEKKEKKKKKKKKKDKEKDKEKEKKKKDKKKKKKEKKKDHIDATVDADNTISDTEAVSSSLGALTVHDIAALDEAVVKVNKAFGAGENHDMILKLVEDQQTNSGLRRADRIPILLYALQNSNLSVKTVLENVACLKKVLNQVESSFLSSVELECEALISMEEAVARIEDEAEKKATLNLVPVMVKGFYDEEIVSEETILKWYYGKLDPANYKHLRCIVSEEDLKAIKDKAKPIIGWLEEADSDTESEEDSDN